MESVDFYMRKVFTQLNQENSLETSDMLRVTWNALPAGLLSNPELKVFSINVYNPSFDKDIIVRFNVPRENF